MLMSTSTAPRCRICRSQLAENPVLCFADAPPAQGFLESPDIEEVQQDLGIYQCESCGTVQHASEPVSYYKDVIRAIAYSEEMANFRRHQLAQWISDFDLAEKNILEVGAGSGEYMSLLKDAGAISVFGLENSEQNRIAAGRSGHQVKKGYLAEDFNNPYGFEFDAFCIFSFMEHWPDPSASLRALYKILRSGAVGLIEVPNFDHILKTNLYSEFTPDHIFYFTIDTFKRVMELNGFEILSIDSVWHNYILSAVIRRREPIDFSNFQNHQDKIINQILSFLSISPKESNAIWGAGHQALSVISLAGLNAHVGFIVDSAEFKQGLYTPGSKILIRMPNALAEFGIQTVLVMAAAYSDEVVNQIRELFPAVTRIGVLREERVEVIKNA
jgi:SAM-dependent methyltransferase